VKNIVEPTKFVGFYLIKICQRMVQMVRAFAS